MNADRGNGDPVDRLYGILSHPLRRAVLETLRGTDVETVDAVVRSLADSERYQADGGEQFEEMTQIEIVLHHHHLPLMADAGVIRYDSETGTVERVTDADVVYDLLDAVSRRHRD